MTRYFGALSSHSKLRRQIILKPGIKKGFVTILGDGQREMAIRLSWSRLLKRVYQIDVTRCEKCGGTINPENCVSYTSPPAIKAMLALLAIQYHGPPIRSARRHTDYPDIDQTSVHD